MKKITPLLILLILSANVVLAQQLTHSQSQTILDGNSVACNTRDINGDIIYVNANTFYRAFDLNDFGIVSSYDVTSVDFGIEQLVNAPAGGYPVTVGVYTVSGGSFPSGTLTLVNEVTENLQDQALVLKNVPIAATIPANSEFVIAISVPSDDPNDGGAGEVRFQIGSNKGGVNGDGDIDGDGDVDSDDALLDLEIASYIKADECGLPAPTTFTDQGRPDVKIVVNVNGNGATASTGDLALVDFSYFPNPVKEKLFLKAKEEISSISVYNALGQEIMRKEAIAKVEDNIDLAALSSGTYVVRARVNDKIGSFKLVKE